MKPSIYTPLQVPYLLHSSYAQHVSYSEETTASLQDFVIALWTMQPIFKQPATVNHVILADGCIDLVVDYRSKTVVFSGMSKTLFHDKIEMPESFFGARMKPGAFAQLTGLPAAAAMDKMLPLSDVDSHFDTQAFFALPFAQAKIAFQQYIGQLIGNKKPNEFVTLFDRFCESVPATTAELYQALHLSPRQCQRLFQQHFALTPQMVLSILRFQRCLALLTTVAAAPSEIMDEVGYYDQPHFIKDFKRNIGLTPKEYLHTLNMSHIYKTSSF
ncbi:MAG: helix-turn-helix domain-containing protein [Oscillospiraceae bacterium]|nr:helix-turn-helix domain-containing protein [Oscillospiraceae bacterium]